MSATPPDGRFAALTSFLAPGTDDEVALRYAALPEAARGTSWGIEDELAFLDVETTGVDPRRDAIIEVAVIVARGPEILDPLLLARGSRRSHPA